MKVLVTGAGGMLGLDLVDALRDAGHSVAVCARADLDVADDGAVRRRVAAESPDAVVNCAAFTNVDGAESEGEEAMAVNGRGARNVAAAAAGAGARVVYVSTDYVFDGTNAGTDGGYEEGHRTGPIQAYGESKLAGERETAAANERHQIVRSSWLFGTRGHNFVETMLRAAGEGRDLRVVDDQVGCPTYTPHLARGIVELLGTDAFGIHHMPGGGSVSWHGFAAEIFRQAGVEASLSPCSTAEFPRPAARPANSILAVTRPETPRLPPWQEGLAAYLAERAERRSATISAPPHGGIS